MCDVEWDLCGPLWQRTVLEIPGSIPGLPFVSRPTILSEIGNSVVESGAWISAGRVYII
jgi:hypothetical protein